VSIRRVRLEFQDIAGGLVGSLLRDRRGKEAAEEEKKRRARLLEHGHPGAHLAVAALVAAFILATGQVLDFLVLAWQFKDVPEILHIIISRSK
jgi:hypothetical protein